MALTAGMSHFVFNSVAHSYSAPRFPEQRLTRLEALRGMTIDPAYASFTENILGSLTIGKRADITILSQDIMSVAADKILGTQVLATIIDGRVVYGRL